MLISTLHICFVLISHNNPSRNIFLSLVYKEGNRLKELSTLPTTSIHFLEGPSGPQARPAVRTPPWLDDLVMGSPSSLLLEFGKWGLRSLRSESEPEEEGGGRTLGSFGRPAGGCFLGRCGMTAELASREQM